MRIMTCQEAADSGIQLTRILKDNPDLYVLVDEDDNVLFWSSSRDDVVHAERAYL